MPQSLQGINKSFAPDKNDKGELLITHPEEFCQIPDVICSSCTDHSTLGFKDKYILVANEALNKNSCLANLTVRLTI